MTIRITQLRTNVPLTILNLSAVLAIGQLIIFALPRPPAPDFEPNAAIGEALDAPELDWALRSKSWFSDIDSATGSLKGSTFGKLRGTIMVAVEGPGRLTLHYRATPSGNLSGGALYMNNQHTQDFSRDTRGVWRRSDLRITDGRVEVKIVSGGSVAEPAEVEIDAVEWVAGFDNQPPSHPSSPSIGGTTMAGHAAAANAGAWSDDLTHFSRLLFDLQWMLATTVDGKDAIAINDATNAVFQLPDSAAGAFIGLEITVTDEGAEPDYAPENTRALTQFLEVQPNPNPTDPQEPPPSELLLLSLSPGAGEFKLYNDGWVSRWGALFQNLTDPEHSFWVYDRIGGPTGWGVDLLRDNRMIVKIEYANRVPQIRSYDADSFFAIGENLGEPTLKPNLFSSRTWYYQSAGPEFYSYDVADNRVLELTEHWKGVGGRFLIPNATYQTGVSSPRILLISSSQDLAAFSGKYDEPLYVLSVPDLELVSTLPSPRFKTSEVFGFSPDGRRLLIPWDQYRVINGQSREWTSYFLIDPRTGTPFQQIPVDFTGNPPYRDRIVNRWDAQLADQQPRTFDVHGDSSFMIARSDANFEFATLEFRSWETGEINRLYRIEDGRFGEGVFFDPTHWLYPLANQPALALLNLETGVIERYFQLPLESGTTPPMRQLGQISITGDGELISFNESYDQLSSPTAYFQRARNSFVVRHPSAPGDVEGLVFDDANGNGQLDLSLIQSEQPHIVYVIDVSGSSADPFQGSPVGDVNADGKSDTILDAEIAAFQEFHRSLIAFGKGDSTKVAVVAFASSAVAYGYDQITQDKSAMVWASADENANQVPDVIEALGKVRLNNGNVGTGTDFRSSLAKAKSVFAASGTSVDQGNIIFLSDGAANANNYSTVVDDLRKIGVNMRAIGVGESSSLPGLQVIDPTAQKVTSTDELIEAFGPEEELLPGIEVFADHNGNGLRDAEEPLSTTLSDNPFTVFNEAGYYRIKNLPPGPVSVRPKDDQFQLVLDSTVNVQPVVKTRHLLAVHLGASLASFSIDSSAFEVVTVGGGQFLAVTVNGTPGRTYQAYVKNALNASEWTPIGAPQMAADGPLTLFVNAPAAATVFLIVAEMP